MERSDCRQIPNLPRSLSGFQLRCSKGIPSHREGERKQDEKQKGRESHRDSRSPHCGRGTKHDPEARKNAAPSTALHALLAARAPTDP